MVGDTGSEGGLTRKCDGIIDRTRNRCQDLRSKTFVLMSHFASRGLCLWDLAAKVLLPSSFQIPKLFFHFEPILLSSISFKALTLLLLNALIHFSRIRIHRSSDRH